MNRPNILIFFCDQLRRDLLGCYGGTITATPNIDALAADGTVFDTAYTPTAICSPARASFLTGLYPHGHHMFNNSSPKYSYCEHLRSDVPLVSDVLDADTEYRTGYFGKWHLGPAEDLWRSSFHETSQPRHGSPAFTATSHWHPNTSIAPLVDSVLNGRAGTLDVSMHGFPDVHAADLSMEFMRVSTDVPFCCYCAFPGPHSPWMVPAEWGVRFDPGELPVWRNRHDPMTDKPLYQQKLHRMEQYPSQRQYLADDGELTELLACCFSYVELIDAQVGRVVSMLKELELYDETMILFTTDHGDMAGSHGFLSKGAYSYEEIYHIPMIAKPAATLGSSPGRREEPVTLMDATATVLHAATGAEPEAVGGRALHGRSLLPLLSGALLATPWRDAAYMEFHGDWYGHYSIRTIVEGRYKLAWNLSDRCELYDLEEDPLELENRFAKASYREISARLLRRIQEEAENVDDAHVRLLIPELELA